MGYAANLNQYHPLAPLSLSLLSVTYIISHITAFSRRHNLGRTIPSYRLALEEEVKAWKGFEDALRTPDREVFENLLDQCRLYASAGSMAVRPKIIETMFMTALFAHHKMLKELSSIIQQIREEKTALNNEPKEDENSMNASLQP